MIPLFCFDIAHNLINPLNSSQLSLFGLQPKTNKSKDFYNNNSDVWSGDFLTQHIVYGYSYNFFWNKSKGCRLSPKIWLTTKWVIFVYLTAHPAIVVLYFFFAVAQPADF